MTAPCDWLMAMLGLTIWLPISAATQTLLTLTRFIASTVTSATSAKYPRCAYWNATPNPRPFGSEARFSQPDRSATALRTPSARLGSKPSAPSVGGGFEERGWRPGRSPGPRGSPEPLGHRVFGPVLLTHIAGSA